MSEELIAALVEVAGKKNVRTNRLLTEYYRSGFRSGRGDALAVVWPQTLLQQWKILQACVKHNTIIVMQAAKTGLTEGSTPSGGDYDRDVVIINTLGLKGLHLLNEGEQVLSFPGSTLHSLEKLLGTIGRAPHSVIGSSCLGASIVGGVANNSGGALVKRGPAYTELALFAQVNAQGELEMVNHLGIEGLGDSPEQILDNLESGNFTNEQVQDMHVAASDREYATRIRDVDSDEPARYNADKRRLFETSGCAGKVAVFAVRLDTFAVPKQEQVFYIGSNNTALLSKLRREMLVDLQHLPESAEYVHREIYDLAERYGKDIFLMIYHLGTDFLPRMFAMKGVLDAYLNKIPFLPSGFIDRLLQWGSQILPKHLPQRMMDYRNRFEHHLIIKTSDEAVEETSAFLKKFFEAYDSSDADYFVCEGAEGKKAYLQRFAAAGAAIRYQLMHSKTTEEIIALDIALRRNDAEWFEQLPEHISSRIQSCLYYGHFFCHVLHQDYIVKKGVDVKQLKKDMLALLTERGAKYPAEHNVGHLYEAEPQLKAFYKELDPTNTFNPGIGKTSKRHCCDGL